MGCKMTEGNPWRNEWDTGKMIEFKSLIKLLHIQSWTSDHTLHQPSFGHPSSSLWWIPLVSFVFYEINMPLSVPVLWSIACCISIGIFSKYCLFGNTWFNQLSGAWHGLFCYLDGLWLKGICINMRLYLCLYTKFRYRSSVGLGGWLHSNSMYMPHPSFTDL